MLLLLFGTAALIAVTLIQFSGRPKSESGLRPPPAFAASTLLLAAGSVAMQWSLHQVRTEKQAPFRRSLFVAAVVGMLFVGLQSYGIWYLLHGGTAATDPQTGVHAFVFAFVVLHALHFVVALMFLAFVAVQAVADRYDHEYYWGVTVCTWFWHMLGAVWAAILIVFVIAV